MIVPNYYRPRDNRVSRAYRTARMAVAAGAAVTPYVRSAYRTGKWLYKNMPSVSFPRYQSAKARKTYVKRHKMYVARRIKSRNPAIQQLDKRITKVARLNETNMGELTYRLLSGGELLANQSRTNFTTLTISGITTMETVMDQLQWYNPATSAFVTSDPAGQAKYQEVTFTKVYGNLTVRNNYQVPCKVRLYAMVPKIDTSITPTASYSNWLTDNLLAGNTTDPCVYLTDSQETMANWRIVKSKIVTLAPGRESVITYGVPKMVAYDSSIADSHALTYQPKFGGCVFVAFVEGVVGHDTAGAEQGLLASGIDYTLERTFVCKYPAGIDCRFLYSSNTLDASFTNGGVVSQQTADNQAYSVS